VEYILGDNGLPIGDLWKAFHEEGVDIITEYGDHSNKLCATWTAAEVKHYNRLHFIIYHIVEQLVGNMNLASALLKHMDGEKGGAKFTTVYTRIKNIINVKSPLKH
jgi:hypothetical protein